MLPRPFDKALHAPLLRSVLFSLTVFLCLSAPSAFAQANATAASLAPDARISREIKGGEKQHFGFPMEEGTAASLLVEQEGIDIAVRVLGPDGKPLVEADLDVRRNGTEKLDFVSAAKQTWTIEIESRNKLDPPGRYEINVARVAPATDRDRSLFDAWILATEGQRLRAAGKYRDALPVLERALKAFESVLGPGAFEVGLINNRIGIIHYSIGDAAKSAEYLAKALAIFEKTLPPDSLHIAEVMNNLAIDRRLKGDYAEAESLFMRSLAIKEKVLGQDSRSYTSTLNGLGILYRNRGDNDRAEQTYEKALEIRERVLGKEHPDVITLLNNIAAAKYYNGDYEGAVRYQTRAVEVAKKNFGADDVRTARTLTDLAVDYTDWGRTDEGEKLYLESLRALRQSGDQSDFDQMVAAGGLGRLYRDRGELDKAKPLLLEALSIAEKYAAGSPHDLARYLVQHANLLIKTGELPEAQRELRRALEVTERSFGPDDYGMVEILDSLALVEALKGDISSALEFQSRANRLSERNIAINLSVGTQHQRLSYLQLSNVEFNQTIALDAEKNGGPEARELAVAAVLQRKGRVLDALAATADLLRRYAGADGAALIERLKDTNARLASFALDKPSEMRMDEYQKQLSEIQQEKDRLEIELSRRTAGYFEPSKVASSEEIRRLIPEDAALLEFVKYRSLGQAAGKTGEDQYVAYVIRRIGVPAAVTLGNSAEIDGLLARFRSSLRDPRQGSAAALGRNAYGKIVRPLRPHLGGVRHVLVSPDGELSLVPFEALLDERKRYLVEDFAITYLTSGRDLVRMQRKRESRSAPVIFANPDYGTPAGLDALSASSKAAANASAARRRSITVARELSGTYFAPLRGTAAEAAAVRQFVPEAEVVTGGDASEAELKSVKAPRILHIATHGFFLTDEGDTAAARIDRNPLLRSGVALAGANARSSAGTQDGLLTALEATGLDLWGTKLVVLSACDTGVGEVRTGEGVFGLRRAFALAGAESLVMSLWPVSDYVTRELMTGYYRNLKQGIGRGESLRRAQLEMLRRPSRRHPFYWASFIRSGEWGTLDGRR